MSKDGRYFNVYDTILEALKGKFVAVQECKGECCIKVLFMTGCVEVKLEQKEYNEG